MNEQRVRAAGGVIQRRTPEGVTEVLLVHRPKYDDWSFPKGKLARGEDEPEAAIREVEEETGLEVTLGPELATVAYRDRYDRPKTVRYWTMVSGAGEFRPNREVDETRWVSIDEARHVLTYDHDRRLLDCL